jgi:hypothetical protein
MAEGKIVNVGKDHGTFPIAKTSSQATSDSIMGMRGPSAGGGSSSLGASTVQVHTPPKVGGGGGIVNTGHLDPGAKPIK